MIFIFKIFRIFKMKVITQYSNDATEDAILSLEPSLCFSIDVCLGPKHHKNSTFLDVKRFNLIFK